MKVCIVTQARFGSSRFPGKVLQSLGQQNMLEVHLDRLKTAKRADGIIVATTHESEAGEIERIAQGKALLCYRGSTDDVLDRFYQAVKSLKMEHVVRVTSDCPLIDGALIDQVIEKHLSTGADYTSNVHPPSFPDGQDVEVFKFSVLEEAWTQAKDTKDREHVTPYIWSKPQRYKMQNLTHEDDLSGLRMTVDSPTDLSVISSLVKNLGAEASWLHYADYLRTHPEIRQLNQSTTRNEGY